VDVIVTDENGHPLVGAEVWAGGRNYSVGLPDRSFLTDAEGKATIPLGEDARISELDLRLEDSRFAAAPLSFEPGEITGGTIEMPAVRAATATGRLFDEDCSPLSNERVIITGPPDSSGSANFIGFTRTNADGTWFATVLPSEASRTEAHPRFPEAE